MNQAGEKMKKDCSLSRLEHGRSERHHLVNSKTDINMMELIGVGLRSVMMVGSGVLRMKLGRSSLEMESTTWSGVEAWILVVASSVNLFPAHR
jgi:hypothetical protein